MKVKRADRGCLTAEASSVREAKAKLEGMVDEALEGYYTPKTITYGRYTAFIYRTPHGWHYRIMDNQEPKPGVQDCGGYSGADPDYKTVEQVAAFHVLDLGGRDEFHKDEDIPAFLMDGSRRRTLLSNGRFQRAYIWKKGESPEMNSTELHKWACDNSNDERFR